MRQNGPNTKCYLREGTKFMAWLQKIIASIFVFVALSVAQISQAAELVMFESEHCPWCEQWHADIGVVYHKTSEGKRAPLRRVDMDGEIPGDLKFLKVGYFTPTFVLMENGKEYGRLRGYPGDEFFWFLLGEMLEKLPAKNSS